jgi:general stress protein 26
MHRYVPGDIRQLRRLLDRIPVGMLVTQTRDGATHARPMLMHDVDESGWLWFVTDRDSRKVCELSQNPRATVTFQSSNGARYISVQGTAIVVRDDVGFKELSTSRVRSWLPRARRSPDVVLVAMRVTRAEYWLLPPTRIPRFVSAAKALMTGRREAGRHGVLKLHALGA